MREFKPESQKGFSLLEVLVAFSILALSLGVLMQIFSGALRNAVLSEQYSRATLLAQSRLAAVGADGELMAEDSSGEAPDGMRWSARVTPFEDSMADLAGSTDQADLTVEDLADRIEQYHVVVRVSWDDGEREREVILESLRIGLP